MAVRSKIKSTKTFCNYCKNETNHMILFSTESKLVEDEVIYMVVQCAGCEEISFLSRLILEDEDPPHVDFNYPEIKNNEEYDFLNNEESWLPKEIFSLYNEIRIAFEYECEILAGIGLRTMVEAICIHQSINGKNLQEKIENLEKQGLISTSEKPILDKLRLIGNSSAHEIKKISLNKLKHALEIINHILKSIYILPRLDKKLSNELRTSKKKNNPN